MKIERNLLALMEAASHSFSRGYSGQQDKFVIEKTIRSAPKK